MKTPAAASNRPKRRTFTRFDAPKEFDGRRYTGMAVGRTHHWAYDKADWKERRISPDKWEFTYFTTKRRRGRASEGSGAPVGTGYHWFILAHQFVQKQNANDYTTQMVGLKLKVAHKRADKEKWNASTNARQKLLIGALEELIAELKRDPEQVAPIPLEFELRGKKFLGSGVPVLESCRDGQCRELDITLNDSHFGIIRRVDGKWKITEAKSQSLANAIGAAVERQYSEGGRHAVGFQSTKNLLKYSCAPRESALDRMARRER